MPQFFSLDNNLLSEEFQRNTGSIYMCPFSVLAQIVSQIVPENASQSKTFTGSGNWGAENAIDGILSSGSDAIAEETAGEVWFILNFDRTYLIYTVKIYQLFEKSTGGWYDGSYYSKNSNNWSKSRNTIHTNVDVSVYKGAAEQVGVD